MVDRTVNLILRARDGVSNTLQNVNRAIDKFGQESREARGEASGAGDAFARLGNAIRTLNTNLAGARVGGAITEDVQRAQQAYERLGRSVNNALTESGRFAQAQRRQAGAVQRLEQEVSSLNAELEKQQTTLRESGQSQRRINAATKELRTTLRQQNAALKVAQAEERRLAAARSQSAATLGQSNVNLRQSIGTLREVQSAAGSAAQAYQRAGQAVRGEFLRGLQEQLSRVTRLNMAFRNSSTAAQQYARQIRSASQPSAELAASFEQARAAAARTRREFRAQRDILARMRTTLRESGTDLNRLAASQAGFAAGLARGQTSFRAYRAELEKAAAATQRLAAAQARTGTASAQIAGTERLGRATRRTARSTQTLAEAWERFYGRGTRQSLSIIQRIRGQILALSAAYVGLFGVIRGFQGVVNVFTVIEAAQARLNAAFGGDIPRVERSFDRLIRTAGRLGIQFGTLATEYSAFAIATQGTALEGERTERIFRQVSEAARVNNLSIDQTRGVFTALSQIVSKGTLSMEELRQQLGDRIPGAVRIYADALDLSVEQLFKLVEAGAISSDTLTQFGDELERRFGGSALANALDTIGAAFGRLQNAAFLAFRRLGDAGTIDALRNLFDQTARTLQSADFGAFLDSLGAAASFLSNVLSFLVQNFRLLAAAGAVLVATRLAPFFSLLGVAVGRLPRTILRTRVRLRQLRRAMVATASTAQATGVAVRGLGSALVGGLAGIGLNLALAAVGAAIGLWATRADEAAHALEGVEAVVTRIANLLDTSGDAEQFFEGVAGQVSQSEIQAQIDQLENLRGGILRDVERDTRPGFLSRSGASFRDFRESVLGLLDDLRLGEIGLSDFNRAVDSLRGDAVEGLFGTALDRTNRQINEFLLAVGTASIEIDDNRTSQQRLEEVLRGLTGTIEDQGQAYENLREQADAATDSERASVRAARSLGKQANALIEQRTALVEKLFRQYREGAGDVDIAETEEAIAQLSQAAGSRLEETIAALGDALGDISDNEYTAPLRSALQSEVANFQNVAASIDTSLQNERARFFEAQLRAYQQQADTIRQVIDANIAEGGTLAENANLIGRASRFDQSAVEQARQAITELLRIESLTPEITARVQRLQAFINEVPRETADAIFALAQAEIERLLDIRNQIEEDLEGAITGGDAGREQQATADLRANTAALETRTAALLDDARATGLSGRSLETLARFIRLVSDELNSIRPDNTLRTLQDELRNLESLRGQLRDSLSQALDENRFVDASHIREELASVEVAVERVSRALIDQVDTLDDIPPQLRAVQIEAQRLIASIADGPVDIQIQAASRRLAALLAESEALDRSFQQRVTGDQDALNAIRQRFELNARILRAAREELQLLQRRQDLSSAEVARTRELQRLTASITRDSQARINASITQNAEQLVQFVTRLRELARASEEIGDIDGQRLANSLLAQYIPLAQEAVRATRDLQAFFGLTEQEADQLAVRLTELNQQLVEPAAAAGTSGPSRIEVLEQQLNEIQQLRESLQTELSRALASGDLAGADAARAELQVVEQQVLEAANAVDTYIDTLEDVPPALRAVQVGLRGLRADLADGSVEIEIEAQRRSIEELQRLRDQLADTPVRLGELGGVRDNIDGINVQLREAVDNALRFVDALDQSLPSTQILRAELEQVRASTQGLGNEFRLTFRQVQSSLQGSIQSGLEHFVDAIAMGESATRSLGDAFRQFAADFLRRIAQMIIEQLAFNAAQSITSGLFGGGLFGGLLSFHQGGRVGAAGNARLPAGRDSLRGDEVLAVLQQGETVFTESQSRALAGGVGGASGGGGVTVINAVDGSSFLEEALRTRGGSEVLLNAIRADRSAIRSTLGV